MVHLSGVVLSRSSVAFAGRASVAAVQRSSVAHLLSNGTHDLAAAAADGEASSSSCSSGSGHTGTAAAAAAAGPRSVQPTFSPLTELTIEQPGSSNPVTDWHNEFIKVSAKQGIP